MIFRRSVVPVVILAVAILLLGTTFLQAAFSGAKQEVIQACVDKKGEIRLLNPNAGPNSGSDRDNDSSDEDSNDKRKRKKDCRKGEFLIEWNVEGRAGATGPKGPAGAGGEPGLEGPSGPGGPKGPIGPEGATGPDGQPGAQGPPGPEGQAGADAQPGAQGPLGPEGQAGADGQPGAQGPPGPEGQAGADAQPGAQGPPGPEGQPGDDGQPGAQGPPGPEGQPGDDGQPGAQGAPGPPGPVLDLSGVNSALEDLDSRMTALEVSSSCPPGADPVRCQFLADLEPLLGDASLIWLPLDSETTASIDASKYAATLTYDATIAGRKSTLGSGTAVDFDGTDDKADTPDANRSSFGNGNADQPISIVVLVYPTINNAQQVILSKFDNTTGETRREWQFLFDGNGHPRFGVFDNSSGTDLERRHGTSVQTVRWQLWAATYDGSGAETGMRLYRNGVRVDDSGSSSGTYTAMENTTSPVSLGFHQGPATAVNFFNGKMALVALTGKGLSIDDVSILKGYVNAFFGLNL